MRNADPSKRGADSVYNELLRARDIYGVSQFRLDINSHRPRWIVKSLRTNIHQIK